MTTRRSAAFADGCHIEQNRQGHVDRLPVEELTTHGRFPGADAGTEWRAWMK
jgi:hypothetical protein